MTRDEVAKLARQAGLGMMLQDETCHHIDMWEGELERFAALVAERTREECARVCDDAPYLGNDACECADLIRSMKAY